MDLVGTLNMDTIPEQSNTHNVALTGTIELQEMDDVNIDDMVEKNTKLSTLITRLISQNSTEIEILNKHILATAEESAPHSIKLYEKHGINNLKLEKNKVICRLCLNASKINNISLGPMVKNMVEHILPEVKLSVSKNPLICSNCLTTLNSSYNFNISCQEVERTIRNLSENLKNQEVVDLNTCNTDGGQTVCRICLKSSKEKDCVKLYSSEDDPLKNMVDKCLPNLNAKLTKDPAMCSHCLEKLEEQFNFVMQCLDTEEKINFYCEEKDKQADVDLYKVFLFSQCIDEEEVNSSQKEDEEAYVLERDCQINTEIPQKPQVKHTEIESHPASTNCSPTTSESVNNKINFVNFSDTNELNDLENEHGTSECDPLGDFGANNVVIKKEKDPLFQNIYDSDDENTNKEDSDLYLTNHSIEKKRVGTNKKTANCQNQLESSENHEEDDLFEEEEIPNKRSRVELEYNTPYPINIIETISLQNLNDISIEDLSNLPIIDARMSSTPPPLVLKNKPKERDYSKDILAQLMDEIDVSDSDQITDTEYEDSQLVPEKSNYFYQYESLEQSDSLNENLENEVQEIPSIEANSFSEDLRTEVQETQIIGSKDLKSEVQETRIVETDKSENYDPDKKILHIQNSETVALELSDSSETNTNENFNSMGSSVPKKASAPIKFNQKVQSKPWFKCHKCMFKTKNLFQLEQHEGAHLLNNSDLSANLEVFRCSFCDFETKFSENLVLHKQVHQMQKVYFCDKPGCTFRTTAKIHVANHKRSHARQEFMQRLPLSCEKCSFKTYQSLHFKQHERVHEKNKHKCEICGFYSSTKGNLKVHIKTHDEKVSKSRMSLRRRSNGVINNEPP